MINKFNMNSYINHPSYHSFLEKICGIIMSNLFLTDYFSLSEDKKRGLSFLTLKILKTTIKSRANYSEKEIIELVGHLIEKNNQMENYELSHILKNIIINYNVINDLSTPKVRKTRIKKESDET